MYQNESLPDTPENKEIRHIFEEAMPDDLKCGIEVKKFAMDHPPDQKYVRKELISWADFRRRHGVRVSASTDKVTKPMTQQEHLIWATTKKGLTEEEAKDQWLELRNDPRVGRDYDGFRGRMQLHVPILKPC